MPDICVEIIKVLQGKYIVKLVVLGGNKHE